METRICIDCNVEKELYKNFSLEGKGGTHRRAKCRSCVGKWNKLPKEERDRVKLEQREVIRTRITKTCPACSMTKERAAFYPRAKSLDGMSGVCRLCDDHRSSSRRKKLMEEFVSGQVVLPNGQACTNCNTYRPINQYSISNKHKSHISPVCKSCCKEKWDNTITDERRVRYLLSRIRSKCSKDGINFDLTIEDLRIPDKCPVLGIPLRFGKMDKGYAANADESSPSVDRIDPEGGYVRGNVIIVSWRANRIKGNATLRELRDIANFYEKLTTTTS